MRALAGACGRSLCKRLIAAQRSLAARGARLELHATRDLLPINLVWQANYGDRGHRRMAGDYCLDLCGVDVFSATDDHLLKPSLDPAVALLIHAGQVAGVQPAIGVDSAGRCLGHVEVTGHHLLPTDAQIT